MLINVNTLKALLLFAAKKDIRYYFNGVHFESGANGTMAVATNGHCLAVASLDRESAEPASFIVPREHLDNVVKGAKGVVDVTKINDTQCTLNSTNGLITVPLCDAKFPDWRRVVTPQQTGDRAYFSVEHTALVDKAGQIIYPRKLGYIIQQNGNSVGYANLNDVIHAYVMPLRSPYEDGVVSSPTFA
jgi:DNA polymerase III sliding clamp (beta) subunit (PCNA family)